MNCNLMTNKKDWSHFRKEGIFIVKPKQKQQQQKRRTLILSMNSMMRIERTQKKYIFSYTGNSLGLLIFFFFWFPWLVVIILIEINLWNREITRETYLLNLLIETTYVTILLCRSLIHFHGFHSRVIPRVQYNTSQNEVDNKTGPQWTELKFSLPISHKTGRL